MLHSSRPKFSLPIRVYYEDTDAAGVVYYASYLRFLERARTEWLRELGFEQTKLAQDFGIAFVARSLSAEYLMPARLDDMLTVVSSIESLGRAQLVFAQHVERDKVMIFSSSIRIACSDPLRGKPTAIPKLIHEKFKALIGNPA